jgi:hypothetical protein
MRGCNLLLLQHGLPNITNTQQRVPHQHFKCAYSIILVSLVMLNILVRLNISLFHYKVKLGTCAVERVYKL